MTISLSTDGYCELADVQRRTGKSYDTNSKPTDTQVESYITERFDIIDGALSSAGFTTPIAQSNTKSVRILRHINVLGAAADAEQSLPGMTEPTARSVDWLAEFNERVKQIAAGTLDLPDLTKPDDAPTTPAEGAVEGQGRVDADGDDVDATFDRDLKL